MADPTEISALSRTGAARCPHCQASLAPDAIACDRCGRATGDRRVPFVRSWTGAAGSPDRKFAWMHQMLDLWVGLGALACQKSVLSLENLSVDRRSNICIERLIRDLPPRSRDRSAPPSVNPNAKPGAPDLVALAQLWRSLPHPTAPDISPDISPDTPPGTLPGTPTKAPDTDNTADRAIATALLEIDRTPNLNVDRLRHILDKHRHAQPLRDRPVARSPAPDDITATLGNVTGDIAGDETVDATLDAYAATARETAFGPVPQLRIDRAARTDLGRQRARNEDNFAIWERRDRHTAPDADGESFRGLYVLCDGMGGHARGDTASQLAAQTTIDFFQSHWRGALPTPATIRDGVFAANRAVFDANQFDSAEGLGRMGTTLVALLVHDTRAAIVNVGDSRLYRYTRDRGLEQLTTDSDLANALIRSGTPPRRAYRHPNAHQLTQAIGPYDEDTLDPDIHPLDIRHDSLFLLASDGLTDRDLLERQDAADFAALLDPSVDLDRAAAELIDLANRENGHDNITVVLVRVLVEPPEF